jgi:hypothetical protein
VVPATSTGPCKACSRQVAYGLEKCPGCGAANPNPDTVATLAPHLALAVGAGLGLAVGAGLGLVLITVFQWAHDAQRGGGWSAVWVGFAIIGAGILGRALYRRH